MKPLNWLRGLATRFRTAVDFAVFWTLTLPWMKVAASLPFWLALVGLGILWTDSGDRVRELNHLNRQLALALQGEDFDTAKLLIERKLTRSPNDADAQYQRALIFASNQETEAASRLMMQLAVGDARAEELLVAPDGPEATAQAIESLRRFRFGRGNPMAGRWLLANHYAPKLAGKLNELDIAVLDALLPWLNEKYPTEAKLAALYADRLLALRMNAEAVPVVERIADQSPQLRFRAAILNRAVGSEEKAKDHAEQALATLRQNSTTAPDAFEERMLEAVCLVFLKRYPEAIEAARLASRLAKTDEQKTAARNKFAQIWVVWSGELITSGGMAKTSQQVLANLQEALKAAPQDPMVLSFLMNYLLATVKEENEETAAIRESLLSSASPGVSHFVRGTSASLRGETEEAAFHLELAAKDLPNSPVILNNLAYMLASQSDPDLPRALQLIDLAIAGLQDPAPHYLDTRGHVLYKMGRWLDAIPGLEQGLKVPDLALAAHEALADCYQQLGKAETSELHRAAAARLKANRPTQL